MKLIDLVKQVHEVVLKLLPLVMPGAGFFSFIYVIAEIAAWLTSYIQTMTTRINSMGASMTGTHPIELFRLANRIIPLSELAGMMSMFLSLMIAAAFIRIVKSFVPTIS